MSAPVRMAPLVRVALVCEPSTVPYRVQASAAGIADLAHRAIGSADREHLLAYLLDAHHGILAVHTAAIGTMIEARVDVAGIFRAAILAACSGLIVAHNHPSGDPVLSGPDRELFDRLRGAGELLGIKVLDTIVVTPDPGTWSSLATHREHLEQAERDRQHDEWNRERFARRERANRSPEEREAFVAAILEARAPEDPVDVADAAAVSFRELARRLWSGTAELPAAAGAALGLRPGASYATAARLLVGEWRRR